ncbi:MAG: 30S ribosomal protein S15 [Candidatus Babeliales bacterium]
MVDKEIKNSIFSKFGRTGSDVGSSEVQVALLSERIRQIAAHLKSFGKDTMAERGLVMLVGKRRKLLNYLKRNDEARYNGVVKSLKEASYL